MTDTPSKSTPKAVAIFRGVSIYKVENSRFWYVRIRDRENKRYIVKSTHQTSQIEARKVAQDLAVSLLADQKPVEKEFIFTSFAIRMIRNEQVAAKKGERSIGSFKAMNWCLNNPKWGLIKKFGKKDVREITTTDFREYMDFLDEENPEWAPSTKNTILATFRNVLKEARDQRVIDQVPDTPRSRQRDNPRPFFRFFPLVSKDGDAYKKVLETAKLLATNGEKVRGIPVTDELYDLILFVTHSFVRPTTSELYSIRHQDVTVADNPRRLIITIRDGKTGFRVLNTMPAAVSVYERIQIRHQELGKEDYIFLPDYKNRITAGKIIQRQFKELMGQSGLEVDSATGMKHSIYSLRHTAICMRLVLSEGKVNIFNLAKNAGTSVEQIERFYARNLPMSAEMARNLQSFGGED